MNTDTKFFLSSENIKWIDIDNYQDIPNEQWIKIYDRSKINYHKPTPVGKKHVDFTSMLVPELPDAGVMILRDATLLGQSGWVVTNKGFLLSGHTWYGKYVNEINIEDEEYYLEFKPGTCLSLTSDWSSINYGHFLLDGLSRLHLFNKLNIDLSKIDYFYCPTNLVSASRLLKKLGIPIERCICPQKKRAVKFEILYAPSFPGIRRVYPSWISSFYKSFITPQISVPFRRIYISRKSTRRITNENKIISILLKNNFEIVDPILCEDPQKIFNEASIIIGAHGSGLADVVFSHKDSRLLELIPSDHIFPYWFSLTNAVGLKYYYLVGKSLFERSNKLGPSPYDFYIDENEFTDGLNLLLKD